MNPADRSRLSVLLVLLLSLQTALGCSDNRSPVAPSAAASTVPPAAAQPTPPSAPVQPTATLVTPNVGSTAGDAWGRIRGTDFQRGATVTFGTRVLRNVYFEDSTTLSFPGSEPHAVGTVDVTVTNPGGLASTIRGAYTYAPPQSFDVNGDWVAHAGPEFETEMRFTIRNDILISMSCGTSGTLSSLRSLAVSNGEFAFAGDDGLAFAGKLVAPVSAVGTISVVGCIGARWWAVKQ